MDEPVLTPPTIWRKPWFERVYKIGIIIKAIDGFLELIAGIAILISPTLVHMALTHVATFFGAHNARPFHFISEYIGHVDVQLVHSGLAFLITFLIFHGVVKIGLVYCLLRRIERAYPFVLVVLGAFVLYEIYVIITTLSIPVALFAVLDILIIWLVWNEYVELRTKNKKMVK